MGCLDRVSKDAIEKLYSQGGYIYSSQGGTLLDHTPQSRGADFAEYSGNNVNYLIYPPRLAFGSGYRENSQAPKYPWEFFPHKPLQGSQSPDLITESTEGFFGISNLPPLDEKDSPHSFRNQLESYVRNNIAKECALDIFSEHGTDITTGNPVANVTITDTAVVFSLSWPAHIENGQTAESANLERFTKMQDIRLRKIHSFMQGIISNDIENISYDISSPANSEDLFSISVIRDFSGKDDLVIATDSKSRIDGKPLDFVFGRKNRMPALHYIVSSSQTIARCQTVTENFLTGGKSLKAPDPDEDIFTEASYRVQTVIPYNGPFPYAVPESAPPNFRPKFRISASDGNLEDYQDVEILVSGDCP